ncbi:amidohydrolase family protein [Xanthobacteraceae bacterium Astr-EGSB]|uniref:amidohydrolase family protein n=1 Tax=Astrobacterium formosum TaxID=3069710 RepID=UPI0027ADF752|nr:amidohydrolase family protein [Xanthobacteraceae bacterium Astr-EGSB]
MDGILDVAIADGKIAAVAADLKGPCYDIIDCTGKLVIPGFVDAHQHCYPATWISLNPDTGGIYNGVPTVVDAGSSGYMTFPDFHDRYITRSVTDVYAMLHLHPIGFAHDPESWDPKEAQKIQTYRVVETVEKYRDRIICLKLRAMEDFIVHKGLQGLDEFLRLCDQCGLPLTLHIGDFFSDRLSDAEVDGFTRGALERLRPGDVIAHAFTGKRGKLFREDGAFDDLIRTAVERGVLLDACVGQTNFSVASLRRAIARGFKPALISSDYGCVSIDGVNNNWGMSLSRFLTVGLSLEDILAMTTINAAKAMRLDDRKGSLRIGREADISVLELHSGQYEFMDRRGGERFSGGELLVPALVVRKGMAYHVIHKGCPPIG